MIFLKGRLESVIQGFIRTKIDEEGLEFY